MGILADMVREGKEERIAQVRSQIKPGTTTPEPVHLTSEALEGFSEFMRPQTDKKAQKMESLLGIIKNLFSLMDI